ncbi:hypothetical protein ACIBKY_37715 [Nonomuraea sp. NPDC050394]|uniref:hypothetical protein n=1 Tax=Nonomuraea sp. NPDC050394 TaxID=3364363 RepID=UPI00379A5E05
MKIALAGLLVLAGCAAEPTGNAAPHGYVPGAEETAEPQYRLVLADGAKAHVLDLLTGKVSAAGEAGDVTGVTGDGRRAFLSGRALKIVDGGAWMVDHGDHVHYYKSAVRDLGDVAGPGPHEAFGDAAVTAVRFGDGTVRLLDRARLDKGDIAQIGGLSADGPVVPYAGHLLVADGDAVQVKTRTGAQVRTIGEGCREPEGAAVTRRGVVVGCADGALVVDENLAGRKIGYPVRGTRATEFHHRPGSTTLAAMAGDQGIWVLDVTRSTWKLIKGKGVLAVNAAGDGLPVLSLTEDGTLQSHDPVSGKRTARTKLLAVPENPVIEVDTARAYVNDPAREAVHEIDYNDGLRRARTFRLGFAPRYMTEIGR